MAPCRFAQILLCMLALAIAPGCLSIGAADSAGRTEMETNVLVTRIAEIEVYPEYLEAYLAAARTVGA